MAYEIEKNVPLPPRASKRKYPFDSMEVGDSFLAPVEERQNVARAVTIENQKAGARFSVRTMKDRSGIRVWRTE